MPLDKLPSKYNRIPYRGQRLLSNCCCAQYLDCGCCFPDEFEVGSICVDYANPGGREACEADGGVPYLLRYPGVPDELLICVPCNNTQDNLITAFAEYGITVGPGNLSLLYVDCGEPAPDCPVCLNLQPFPETIAARVSGGIVSTVPAFDVEAGPGNLAFDCYFCTPGSPICQIPGSCYQPMREYYTGLIDAMVSGTLGGGVSMQRNPNAPCCWNFEATATVPEGPQCLIDALGVEDSIGVYLAAEFCVGPCGPYFQFSASVGSGWASMLPCFSQSLFTFAGVVECDFEDPLNCLNGCNFVDTRTRFNLPGGGDTDDISEATGGTLGWKPNASGNPLPWKVTVGAC